MRRTADARVATPPSVLLVSPDTETRSQLQSILQKAHCRTFACARCRDAIDLIHLASAVVCERVLPDGSWLDVLHAAQALTPAPALIVTSRLTDAELWAEVLHLGGYDLLAQPFHADEVMWAVTSAHGRWAVGAATGTSQRSAALAEKAPRAYALR